MVQVNLAVVMGVLIILTGIALVGVQVMESSGGEMDNHSFKLIALGMLLLIVGALMSRGP
jgi:hypothetical protein